MFNEDVPPLERIYKGARIGLLVLGRTQIADLAPAVPYLIISVTDPDRPDASVLATPLLRAVLRLRFHDNAPATGVSRSAGIAAALSRILQGDDSFFFANYWPNKWVYRTILDASLQ